MDFWNRLSRNQKIIAASAGLVALLLIIALVLWLVLRTTEQAAETTPTSVNTTTSTTTESTSRGQVVQQNTDSIDSTEEQAIIAASKSVAERFGSFSTDTRLENVEAMERGFFTADGLEAARRYVTGQLNQRSNAGYYAIATVVANVSITDYSAGATGATTLVTARRTEDTGSTDVNTYTQTARVQLVKQGDIWVVDLFQWQ